MSEQVSADQIEKIVGASRHPTRHIARAVSAERKVYILHSEECRRFHKDLRDCRYSRALDRGIEAVWEQWEAVQDKPVIVTAPPGDFLYVPINQDPLRGYEIGEDQ